MPDLSKNVSAAFRGAARFMMPPPELTISQWADTKRVLSPESCPEPGQWRTDRTPYLRGIMDAVNDPHIEDIVIKSSAQVGKTEFANNVIGYFIDQDPSPILYILPTVELARDWSRERLGPMVRDTPCLRGKVHEPRSRKESSTMLHKKFAGGHLTMGGANAPSGLAARPIRILICDEVDRYPISAGKEGDPVSLGEARTRNFWNRKRLKVSTPTVKYISRIDAAYEDSDQRHYFVPCPKCRHMQTLRFGQIKWEKNAAGEYDPATAHYECEHCRAPWTDADKIEAVEHGEWRAAHPGRKVVGFHINALYSPWSTWAEIADGFLKSHKNPELFKTFINTVLGETWETEGDTLGEDALTARCEAYPCDTEGTRQAPEGVCVITAGVDVQPDRLEVEFVGWGRGEESWSLAFDILQGDTAQGAVWEALDQLLDRRFPHALGITLNVAAAFVDSGFATQAVYRFVKPRKARRIWASKGISGWGRPPLGRPSANNRQKVTLWPLGVDPLKESLFARLHIEQPGAGFCHFPKGYDTEFFAQLTAEKLVRRYRRGFPVREWQKIRPRNEALDCRILATAALISLSHDVPQLLERLAKENREIAEQIKKEKSETQNSKPENRQLEASPESTRPHRIEIRKSSFLSSISMKGF